jgi:hypothetical protein
MASAAKKQQQLVFLRHGGVRLVLNRSRIRYTLTICARDGLALAQKSCVAAAFCQPVRSCTTAALVSCSKDRVLHIRSPFARETALLWHKNPALDSPVRIE